MSSPSTLEHKKFSKDKGKAKARIVEPLPRNEGVDPTWAYKPPDGMVVLDTTHIDEQFDWDLINKDDNKQLWIVRVPDGFKLSQLQGLQIPKQAPGPTKISTLQRKRANYDVWAIDPSNPHSSQPQDDKHPHPPPRGEELTSLVCLLPRKKKGGNLYIAPKPVSRHIVVTHAPAAPHVDPQAAAALSTRQRIPQHLLKHTFMPYGAASFDDNVLRAMHKYQLGGKGSADGTKSAPESPLKTAHLPPSPTASAKKRKDAVAAAAGEDATPRRSKKQKL